MRVRLDVGFLLISQTEQKVPNAVHSTRAIHDVSVSRYLGTRQGSIAVFSCRNCLGNFRIRDNTKLTTWAGSMRIEECVRTDIQIASACDVYRSESYTQPSIVSEAVWR